MEETASFPSLSPCFRDSEGRTINSLDESLRTYGLLERKSEYFSLLDLCQLYMGPAAAQGKHTSPELAMPLRCVSPQATGQH